jgi:RimJ/RimL family protein N-acetyltransferase
MELHTTRLLLREFILGDYDELRQIQLHPQMAQYEPPPLSEDEARHKLERWALEQFIFPRPHYAFALIPLPDKCIAGWVTLTLNFEQTGEWEIGWSIEPDSWGRGYATEAARAVVGFAFGECKAHRISAFCAVDNAASVRVMEKLGMTREGRLRQVRRLRGEWTDEYVYSLLEGEFC